MLSTELCEHAKDWLHHLVIVNKVWWYLKASVKKNPCSVIIQIIPNSNRPFIFHEHHQSMVSIKLYCMVTYLDGHKCLCHHNVVFENHVITHFQYHKKDGYRQLNVHQLGSLRPWDHRGKCYMGRKRIQYLSNASQHVHICTHLQPFTRYSEILVGNCNFFLPPWI